MNEEMMDEHATDHNLVQPGWKISDNATPSASNFNSETPSSKAVSSTEAESAQQRAGWGQPSAEKKDKDSDEGGYESDSAKKD